MAVLQLQTKERRRPWIDHPTSTFQLLGVYFPIIGPGCGPNEDVLIELNSNHSRLLIPNKPIHIYIYIYTYVDTRYRYMYIHMYMYMYIYIYTYQEYDPRILTELGPPDLRSTPGESRTWKARQTGARHGSLLQADTGFRVGLQSADRRSQKVGV